MKSSINTVKTLDVQNANEIRSKLTHREHEILELIATGAAQKEIADYLAISHFTVDVHVKNIKQKTGLQKATELSALYFTNTYHLQLSTIPESVRRLLAGAMLALSVFTAVLHTTDMLRVIRPARTARTMQTRGRGRSRRSESDYEFIPYDPELEKLQLTA